MAASEWYTENKIPKVRWMHIGGNYKARYLKWGLKDRKAVMYVHVFEADRVAAFADAEMQHEIGILPISDFEKIAIMDSVTAPEFSLTRALTVGTLIERIEFADAAKQTDEDHAEQLRLF